MPSWITSPRDFWTGIVYIGLGAGAFVIAQDYSFGTVRRMGPGFFPTILALILIGIGAASLLRSFVAKGEPIAGIAWKPLVLVTSAIVLYGLLVTQFGLPVALCVLIIVSASASREFKLAPLPLAGGAALVAFAVAVFIKGLGLPIPLVGPSLKAALAAVGITF